MQGLVPRTVLLNNNIAVPNSLLPNADRDKGITLRRIPSLTGFTALPHCQLRKGACRAIQTRSRRCARDNLKVPFLALDHSGSSHSGGPLHALTLCKVRYQPSTLFCTSYASLPTSAYFPRATSTDFGTHLLLAPEDSRLLRLERTHTFFKATLVSRILQAHNLVMLGGAIGRWDRSIAYNRLHVPGSRTPSVACRHAHDSISYHLATVLTYKATDAIGLSYCDVLAPPSRSGSLLLPAHTASTATT